MDEILKAIESGDMQPALEFFGSLDPKEQKGFLEQVGSLRDANAARFLSTLLPTLDSKDLKKQVKKLLFHLKTQGIQVDEPRITGDSVLKKVEVAREQVALLSNYDHEGIRVVLFAFEVRRKHFVFTHTTQRFGEGMLEIMSAPMDKKDLDGLLADYRARTRSSMVLVDISPAYALYLTEEASRQSGKKVEEIRALKRLATALAGDVRTPNDIHGLQAPASGPEPSWQQVVAGPLFQPFVPSWPHMEEDVKAFDATVRPQIVLPPYVIEEKKVSFLKELAALDRMKSLRTHLSRMLEDYAYLLYRTGEYAGYNALIKTIRSTDGLESIMQFFLEKSLDRKKEEERQTAGLIVNPYTRNP